MRNAFFVAIWLVIFYIGYCVALGLLALVFRVACGERETKKKKKPMTEEAWQALEKWAVRVIAATTIVATCFVVLSLVLEVLR